MKIKLTTAIAAVLTASMSVPALAVLTPGPGVTTYALPSYNAFVSGPTNSDGGFNQTHLAFDGSGASSFRLTSIPSVGDNVTFSGTFFADPDAAAWDLAGAGAHRSRLFLQSSTGAPLASPLPGGAQRDDMNFTPGVTTEYNTSGFNDNTNWDYLLDNTNQVAAGDYTTGNPVIADFDSSNGAAPDSQVGGGLTTLSTRITRTGASTFSWTSTIDYRFVDDPSTIIASASRSGVLSLPGIESDTYFTPFNQLGIGDTLGAWDESISNSALTFNVAVPEPTSLAVIGGASVLGLRRRRRA